MASIGIPCAIIRGGTTKGIYIDGDRLPRVPEERDRLILSLFGSPDTRQINGLGGADPLTSKVALVCRSKDPDFDIEYRSGEVGIDEPIINYGTMCGNLAAGAALFAIEQRWVNRTEPVTRVHIRNENTGKRLSVAVPVVEGQCLSGPCEDLDQVRGPGVKVKVCFQEPAGAVTGVLLPTGRPIDELFLPGLGPVFCSIVDCGTLYGFVGANSFGLSGTEAPDVLDNRSVFRELIEVARQQVADVVGSYRPQGLDARRVKMAIVAPPTSSSISRGTDTVDLVGRVINRYRTHKAFPVTGAICLSAACAIEGTLLHQYLEQAGRTANLHEGPVCIGHPSGTISVQAHCESGAQGYRILSAELLRSARLLMKGTAYAELH